MNRIKATRCCAVEHPAAMPTTSTPPSCCAGLRQTLMQGWQEAFPLHPSPFRQMAASSGATPRELLSTCVDLHRSGALQPIRVHWGEVLRRERWRLAFESPAAPAALVAALARLPGCDRIERPQDGAELDTVWAEIEAVDREALDAQLARLPQPPSARLRLAGPERGATLPCDDPRLAAAVEQGLKLCARPYADCARRLDCSEQRVLAKLQGWRRTGQLVGLTLRPAPARVSQPAVLALWRSRQPAPAVLAQLAAQRHVDRLICRPAGASWPWQFGLVLRATPQLMFERLRELLQAAGMDVAPDACVALRIEQPRDQALLFSDASMPGIAGQALDRGDGDAPAVNADQAAVLQLPQHAGQVFRRQ